MSDPEYIDPHEIRPGPIRHDSLPEDLLALIKAVFDLIGPYLGMTLEEFEIGFMRDADPASEVALWCGITEAWLDYHDRFVGEETLPADEEKNLLGALIAISSGVDDVIKLNVPEEVGRRLIKCYEELGEN